MFGFAGATVLTLARAVAKRIAGGTSNPRDIEAMKDEIAMLRAEVEELHHKVGDVDDINNRLDFTERVIGQLKNKGALPGGDA